MEFTGERYIPAGGDSRDELSVEHMHRYHCILPLIKGKVVLDIACGEGYGADLIAKTAQKVVGVDISQECITHANDKYVPVNSNLEFLQGDVENIPVPDAAFDVIVSFETMEHVSSEGQKKFLAEAKRVLKKNGKIIISTPDIENYTNRYHHENQFHVHELNRTEFREILNAHFKNVHYLEQGFGIVGYILPPDYGVIKNIQLNNWQRNVKQLKGKYLLAVASDASIDTSEVNSIVMDTDKDYFKQIDRILELQDEVEGLSGWGTKLDQEVMELRAVIRTLNEQVTSLQSEPIREMAEKINQVQQWMENDLKQKNEFIQSLQTEITRLTEVNDQKTDQIQSFESELTGLNQVYQEKKDEILSLQAEIAHLNQINQVALDAFITENNKLIENNQVLQLEIRDKVAAIDKLAIEQRSLHGKNRQLEERLAAFERELKEKERQYSDQQLNYSLTKQQLSEINNRLITIYDSDGWRALNRYYNIKGKYLAENSILYRGLKKIYNFLRFKKDHRLQLPAESSQSQTSHFQPVQSTPVNEEDIEVRTLPYFEQPVVSIIIPVYNAWEMNEKCIASIIENTSDVSYEVIIADDASTDPTRNISKYFLNCVHVRNEENLRFLHNCNNASRVARGKYLHFLNNDTIVKPGWLSSLVMLMEKDERVGMAGSKLVYPDGRLQEAGGIIWNDASGWNFGHGQNPDLPQFNYVREVDYISGASILIRTALWQEIGMFDERYAPAYCEDSDLAFEVRKKGYKVMYQPLSEVIHYEGYSHGSDREKSEISSIKEYQYINNRKFFEKWADELDRNHFPNAENVFWARDRSKSRKTILMIDHYVPQFDKDAGSKTTFQYLELFVKLGYNVKFLGENFYRHEPYTTILQQMGIEVLYGPWYAQNWQQWFIENSEKFDYVYLNRPHIAINFIDFIKANSQAKIIYYGHDLHFLRKEKRYELEKDKSLLVKAAKWKEIEMYLFSKSDIILTPSTDEQKIIQALDDNFNVQLMRPYIYKTISEPATNFHQRKDLFFIGGFGHSPNVDGVLWFVKEVWPLIKAKIRGVKFIIAGSNAPQEIKDLATDPDIVMRGFVEEEELQQLYASSKLAIIPLRYGAGVKGKTVEAMRYAIPLVTTSFGVEGLPGDASFIEPVQQPSEFAAQVVTLYNDEAALARLSAAGVEYIKENFSEKVATTILETILEEAQTELTGN